MQKAIFLDRDGTIIKGVNLLVNKEDVQLEYGAAEAIKKLNAGGFKTIIVTNQPQVARGLCSESDIKTINTHVMGELEKLGAYIDAAYFCPHHPETHHKDVPEYAKKYRIDCECRKPSTGMIKKAVAEFGIDLSQSWFIGDRTTDVQTGRNAGCRTILVKTGDGGRDGKHDIKADYEAANILEAAEIVSSAPKQKIKAVILAGGRGERLRPLTDSIPKPMIEIGGRPALEYHVALLKAHGITDIVMCISYLANNIKDHLGNGSRFGVTVSYSEEKEPLGSGGTIKNAESFLKGAEHFVVLSGDVMTDIDISSLIDFHLANNGLATLVVRESDHPIDSDIVEVEDGTVVKYIGRGQDKHKTGNTGIMVLDKRILGFIPEGFCSIEKDVIFNLIGKEKITAYNSSDYIKDFGTHERLESVRKHFEFKV